MTHDNRTPQWAGPPSVYRPGRLSRPDETASLAAPWEPSDNDDTKGQGASVRQYLRAVIARKWLILAAGFVGAILGAAHGVMQQPIYPASTTIEIQGLNENFMNFNQVDTQAGSGAYSATSSNIQTQIRILESLQLRERVLERLNLEKLPPPAESGYLQRLRMKLGVISQNPRDRVREALLLAIETTKPAALRETRIIEIRCMSTSPEIAATYLNALVNEFVEQTMEFRSVNARRTSEWLVNQLEDTRMRLEQIDSKLRAFERATGYTASTPQETLAGTKVRQLQTELSAVQTERIAKQTRWELARSSSPDTLPEIIDDTALRARQTQILDLRKQLADLTTVLTPAHYQVKRVMAQLAQVEAEALKDRRRVLDRIRGEYEAALKREKLLAGAYSGQRKVLSAESEQSNEHQMLRREREVAQQTHNALMQQVSQASMAAAIPANQVRPIDRAKPIPSPQGSGPVSRLFMGACCGVLLGIGFVVAREVSNRTVRTPNSATELLNVPELAVIPSLESAAELDKLVPARLKDRPSVTPHAPLLEGTPTASGQVRFWGDRPTIISESFRLALASLIIANDRRGRCQTLVITSPGPGEGKTFVTAHLGIAMAEAARRTLLIDMDFRRPSLYKEFGLNNSNGITDLLRGELPIEGPAIAEVMKSSGIKGLNVITAGKRSVSGAGGFVYSPKLLAVLDRLRNEFDFILIDTGPMLAFSDARALGRISDGVVMVLRADVTERDAAVEACRRLGHDGTPLIGTVLNDLRVTQAHYSHYLHYGAQG